MQMHSKKRFNNNKKGLRKMGAVPFFIYELQPQRPGRSPTCA